MMHRWMLGLLGLGMGLVPGYEAMATTSLALDAPYNCQSREVWSPEKAAWCRAHAGEDPATVDTVVAVAVDDVLANQLQNTEWLLEDLNGRGVLDRVQTTLQFDDENRIAGSGGCNRYFATIAFAAAGATATDQAVEIGPVGSTRMACPEAVMNQEQAFFEALRTAERIERDGSTLYVYSVGQEQPMRLTQINTPAPVPGLW